MKRFFSRLLIYALIATMLFMSGCTTGNKNEKLSVKESLNSNYDNLVENLKGTTEFSQLSNYLVSWAKKNKINVKKSNDNYVVLSKPAAANYHDADPLTLQNSVTFDSVDELAEDLECTAISLATLYSAEYHGPIKVIVTEKKHGKAVGAQAVESNYINKKNFISLNYAEDPKIYNKIAASSSIITSQKIKSAKPKYTKAYKIKFKGLAYKNPYMSEDEYTNAIKAIGDLLASCKSSGVLFELAKFKGGDTADLLPETVTAIVVVQENDEESFLSKFESSYEQVEDKYTDLDETFEYTATPTKMPSKVISTKHTSNIISLLYTLKNVNSFHSDEGDLYAKTCIGVMGLNTDHYKMSIDAKSLSDEYMNEMRKIFETTSGLCEVKYKEISTTPLWAADPDNKLIATLSDELDIIPQGALENTDGSTFIQKKSNVDLVMYESNLKDGVYLIDTLITYMMNLNQAN